MSGTSCTLAVVRLLLLLLIAAAACNKPTYRFEPRPPTPAPRTDAERCFASKRLELATGRWSWRRDLGGATTIVPSAAGGFSIHYGEAQHKTYGNAGLVVYRGGERFSALAALDALEAPELSAIQREVIAANDNLYGLWQVSTLALTGVGTIGVGVGTALLLADPSSDDNTGPYIMLGGLGVLTLALVPAVFAYTSLPKKMTQERDRKLLVHPAIARAVRGAVERKNARIAAGCGATPVTPMTERAARMAASSGNL